MTDTHKAQAVVLLAGCDQVMSERVLDAVVRAVRELDVEPDIEVVIAAVSIDDMRGFVRNVEIEQPAVVERGSGHGEPSTTRATRSAS